MTITLEIARSWYAGADTVHAFDHIERVTYLAERLARLEGANLEIVRTAALLHDSVGGAPGKAERKDHHLTSADFAGKVLQEEGWPADRIAAVQHCIRAHRYRAKMEAPQTIEAKCLFDADKLDVLGAVGVARTIAYAALAGQPFFAQPSDQFLRTGTKLPDEPHSAYHEYLFKLRRVKERLFTRAAREIAEERDAYLADYFERLQREIRGEC
jgi:uncharacterized protein